MIKGGVLKYYNLHPWQVRPDEAERIQSALRERLSLEKEDSSIRTVAGADVAYRRGKVIGGVVVFQFPDLKLIENEYALSPATFPYIPGLLSFREGPVLLKVFEKLKTTPDVIIFDGQGIAHPRRMGIAAHLGILLDRPTVGCAKSILLGNYTIPADEPGAFCLIRDRGEAVGAALRTKRGVKPVFVSPGNRIDIPGAIRIVLECTCRHRLPEPLRQAHAFVAKVSKSCLAFSGLCP